MEKTKMTEAQQKQLEHNRELALIAFHTAHGAADMLEIAQQLQEDAEGDTHFVDYAGRLIDGARCLCVGLVHQIDELWDYLKELEREAKTKDQSVQELGGALGSVQ
jgi:hypothetical protein